MTSKTRSGMLAPMLFCLVTSPALAIDLPKEPGWGGFLNIGLGSMAVKSNIIAGNDLADIGDDTIESLNEKPGKSTATLPTLNFRIGYFFDQSKTYVFLGNNLEDLVRYDFTTALGVYQGWGGNLFGFEVLSTGIRTNVWADPYVSEAQPGAAGPQRVETDRDAPGARLTWDRIGGSGLKIELTGRRFKVEDEHSGEALGLPPEQRELLEREGPLRQAEIGYRFRLAGRHFLTPKARGYRYDVKGGAVAHDRKEAEIEYFYNGEDVIFTGNIYAGTIEADEVNPVFGKTGEGDLLGGSAAILFPKLFHSERWAGMVSLATYNENSNIDFYDTNTFVGGVSAFYRF